MILWPLVTLQLGFAFWSHFARQRIDVEQGGPEFRACHIYLFLSYALSSAPTSTIYYFICSTLPSCSVTLAYSYISLYWNLAVSASRTLSFLWMQPNALYALCLCISLPMTYFALTIFVRELSMCNDLFFYLHSLSLSSSHFTFYENSVITLSLSYVVIPQAFNYIEYTCSFVWHMFFIYHLRLAKKLPCFFENIFLCLVWNCLCRCKYVL